MSKMEIVEVEKVVERTPTIRSLYFEWEKEINPGQFIMVWVPGVDEMPMALSHQEGKQGITVKKRGEGTSALHEMEEGDRIGIRGPYGSCYDIRNDVERILAVIGGYGASSVRPALFEAKEKKKEITSILGAETADELLFRDDLSSIGELQTCTDDGSAGHEGFVTDLIDDQLSEGVDLVLTCGPEVMLKKVVERSLDKGTPVQASLERYMKCGMGLCDSCSIDGYQVCRDGPIFKGRLLKDMDEFGKYERDRSGKRIPL